MLYSELIELRRDESGPGSWCSRTAHGAPSSIDGHGTGVSTGVGTDPGSFAPATAATPPAGAGWDRLTQALSVTGNVLAGAAFLGGLYFAPLALERLTALL
jgi:hypothetical protein